jgi:hypothetical protein
MRFLVGVYLWTSPVDVNGGHMAVLFIATCQRVSGVTAGIALQ